MSDNVYEDAADILEKGWCKHSYEDVDGNHCVMGALYRATENYEFDAYVGNTKQMIDEMTRALAEFDPEFGESEFYKGAMMDDRLGCREGVITSWNDDMIEDQQKAIDFLRFMGKKTADQE
ncbi:hypothetical protein SEA_KEELAN_107 [Gordonia phage Keelan]|nr:hypothetical protein SEA_KEELAN_107 [Gordonia phage Keelan]